MPPLWQLQKIPGKGVRGSTKKKGGSLRRFLTDQKIANSWGGGGGGGGGGGNAFWGNKFCTSNKLLLVARHILTTGLQKMPLKLAV